MSQDSFDNVTRGSVNGRFELGVESSAAEAELVHHHVCFLPKLRVQDSRSSRGTHVLVDKNVDKSHCGLAKSLKFHGPGGGGRSVKHALETLEKLRQGAKCYGVIPAS